VLYDAWAINKYGQIAGVGVINGHYHAYLLTPDASPHPALGARATPAVLTVLPAPMSTSFVVSGALVLSADVTLVSTAGPNTMAQIVAVRISPPTWRRTPSRQTLGSRANYPEVWPGC
jgi:hypothetical protein